MLRAAPPSRYHSYHRLHITRSRTFRKSYFSPPSHTPSGHAVPPHYRRTETIHGVVCKYYDGGVVKVGTSAASRFTVKVPSDEESWFSTRLRAELIKRELATASELAVDEVGEAAMAAKAAASAEEASKRAAWKKAVAAEPRRQAAAALESAEHAERIAGHKRALAEKHLELAEGLSHFKRTAPAAHETLDKAASLVKFMAAKAAPEARAKLETMAATVERAQSAQTKLESFWGRVEVRTQCNSRIFRHTCTCHTCHICL